MSRIWYRKGAFFFLCQEDVKAFLELVCGNHRPPSLSGLDWDPEAKGLGDERADFSAGSVLMDS